MENITDFDRSEHNRLAWQCRRGMRELDELLNVFLAQRYRKIDRAAQQGFARLLDYPDDVLLELLMGRMAPADKDVANIVQEIRNTTTS